MKKTQYIILSPDGFAIGMDTRFDSPELAWKNLEKWKIGFERQGYYSTVKNNRRVQIPLEELKNHCRLDKV